MEPQETTNTKFILGDKTYDKMKFIALQALPALTTLVFALGSIWHMAHVTEVIGTMTAVDTFLGVMLGISTKSYNANESRFAGNMLVSQTEAGKLYSLEMNGDVGTLDQQKTVTFKVVAAPPQ